MLGLLLWLSVSEPAEHVEGAANSVIYDCTVNASATVRKSHLEGSTPDASASNDPEETYVMEVTFLDPEGRCIDDCGVNVKVREIPSRKTERWIEYCNATNNQVLAQPYSTVSSSQYYTKLHADNDVGILTILGDLASGGKISFWHAGFQYPGCEDTELTVRTGVCSRRDSN